MVLKHNGSECEDPGMLTNNEFATTWSETKIVANTNVVQMVYVKLHTLNAHDITPAAPCSIDDCRKFRTLLVSCAPR